MTFCCAEEPLCHLWLQTLRELLEKLSAWREARSPGARKDVFGLRFGRRGPAWDPVIVAASLPFAHLPVTKCTAELGWLKNILVLPVTGPAWHRALPQAWPSRGRGAFPDRPRGGGWGGQAPGPAEPQVLFLGSGDGDSYVPGGCGE